MDYCVRVNTELDLDKVMNEIQAQDDSAYIDHEDGAISFTVETTLPQHALEEMDGVEEAFNARYACPCGSGKWKQSLNDARGIFCCYTCEDCEDEKKARYRPEIFEDGNYECEEQIEDDY
jgi:hypothetical protein